MAGKVFFSVSMSADGFIVPESMEWLRATPEQREQDASLGRLHEAVDGTARMGLPAAILPGKSEAR